MWKLWRAGATTRSIAGEHPWVYILNKETNMIAFLALWLCVLSVVAIYYTIPPSGMRPDIYGFALWILSSCALATSAIIIVVSLVSPQAIHPKWLDSRLSPPHYSSLRN
jgi:hypothetical protein